ncbi:molybdopterin converting factor subunit 1 [Bacillus sp. ISL-35]|uniref:molybdopterin converting factor subunit 1 n=1 Tax=Bacillus sp. ISL-35 TaxID=2819122 RepID=UPI001BEACFA2|nr:molybdopterin converting factor subunit 1 [Bacillus sp. ISL-35]MBT2681836.1 molybdopterin converting factor subunit 1 [Bacillus sp. ISL-35]MBT2706216.1 molybdopterin converting factor subunit 1 [Chryseobacterium sp. ISL-80]
MNKILFFAHLRDEAGYESVEIEAAGKTVAELKQIVAEKYGVQKLDTSMTAINEEFSSNDEVIKEGDTIAFIPPVSGG